MLGLLMMLSAAATGDRPSIKTVERIEAEALRDPCVRPLSQWWRQYAFAVRVSPRGPVIDRNVVQVSMIEAGHHGYPAGRFIRVNPRPPAFEHSQFKLAFGEYDLTRKRFVRWYCGGNLTGKAWGGADSHF